MFKDYNTQNRNIYMIEDQMTLSPIYYTVYFTRNTKSPIASKERIICSSQLKLKNTQAIQRYINKILRSNKR